MATPQIDRIFWIMMTEDYSADETLHVLAQEISILTDRELQKCLKVAKRYRKDFRFFYDMLKTENDKRVQEFI